MMRTPAGRWLYCVRQVPQYVLDQLQYREDNQIQVLEGLALRTGPHTLESFIKEGCVTAFTDNNSVMQSFLKGTSNHKDLNRMAGRLWSEMAERQVGI